MPSVSLALSTRSEKSLLKLSCQLLHTSVLWLQSPGRYVPNAGSSEEELDLWFGCSDTRSSPVLCKKVWDAPWVAFFSLDGQLHLPDAAPWSTGSPSPASPSLLGRKSNPARWRALAQGSAVQTLLGVQDTPWPLSYPAPRSQECTKWSQLCWKWNYPPLMSQGISGISWCYWWLLVIYFYDPLRNKGKGDLCVWC